MTSETLRTDRQIGSLLEFNRKIEGQ